MDRYTITPEEQTIIDDYRTNKGTTLQDVVVPGSNLVVDDHIEVDNAWKIVVLAPGEDGMIDCLMIEWGDMVIPNFDLAAYISDRAGPDGQTMPIYDEVELQARALKAEGGANPKQAARAERKEERADRRGLKDALRDALKRLPHDQQQHARALLRGKGVLGKDDDEHGK